MHSITSQEKQEYAIQDKPAVVDVSTKAAPFVSQKICDKRMAKKIDTFFGNLKKLKSHVRESLKVFQKDLREVSASIK